MAVAIRDLLETHAGEGRVMWLGVRPERRTNVVAVNDVEIGLAGLDGDRRTKPGKRAVTLVQWEHLPVIASLAHRSVVTPEMLRRNIAVAGINLLALRKSEFRVGTALLRGSGLCAPCSRMEEALGPGGYNAVRGHGGLTAEVVEPGSVTIGDGVIPIA